MRPTLSAFLVLFFSLAASRATSQTAGGPPPGEGVVVEPFDRVELIGGGTVSIWPGSEPRVALLGGAERTMQITTESGTLRIECRRPCPSGPEGVVHVSVPFLTALRVSGGGTMEISDGFPPARELQVEVRGGGTLRASALVAESVRAAVHGGGSVYVSPTSVLHARIRGGGGITYSGNPEIRSDVDGGGSIRRAGEIPSGAFRDARDGRLHGTVRIGEQVWMARE